MDSYKENELLSVAEIADKYNITTVAVRYWIKKGLPTSLRKVMKRKAFIVIDPEVFEKFIGLSK